MGAEHWNYKHGHCTKEARKQTVDGNAYVKQLEKMARRDAVTVFVCQIGLRILRMSSVSISSKCLCPIAGSAYCLMVAYH
jgi:hypothetical protein